MTTLGSESGLSRSGLSPPPEPQHVIVLLVTALFDEGERRGAIREKARVLLGVHLVKAVEFIVAYDHRDGSKVTPGVVRPDPISVVGCGVFEMGFHRRTFR